MKKSIAFGLILAVIFLRAATAHAAAFEARWYTEPDTGLTLPYRLFTPLNYDPQREYPLITFLHGAGQSGTDNTLQINNYIDGIVRHVETEQYAAFVLAPQTDSGWMWYGDELSDSTRMTLAVIEMLGDEFNIDPRRRYVTGLSMGGGGTWDVIGKRPGFFAAAMPVCGYGDPDKAVNMVNQPIWAFHARNDGTVGVESTREMVDAVRAAGGDPIYTEYYYGGHGIWHIVYDLDEHYEWMYSQALTGNPPTATSDTYGGITEDDAVYVVAPEAGVLINDSDPDNDPLTAIQYSEAAHGLVSLNSDGPFYYVPEANYCGTDRFTYRAYDGGFTSRLATVTLEIAAVNDAPVAAGDSYSIDENARLTVPKTLGVLANDTDVETPTGLHAVLASDVADGELSLNDNGSFSYQPDEGFFGQDSFVYRAFDGEDYSELTTVLIHVLSAVLFPGDANRDGRVDEADAAILSQYWGQGSATWAMGDFDGDTVIGLGDASILAANWGYGTGEGDTPVPEPTALGLLFGLATAATGLRRRTR